MRERAIVSSTFVRLFVRRSFVRRSFVRSEVRSFRSSFVPKFVPKFVRSEIRSFVPKFVRSEVTKFRSSFRSYEVPKFVPKFLRSFIHSFVRSFVCIVDVVSVFGCYAFNCALHSGLDVNNKARVRVCNCNIVNSPIHRAPPFRYCSLNVRSPRRYRHWKRPELPTCGLELSVCLPSCACVLVTAVFEKRKQTAEDLFVDWTSSPACGLAACKI